MPIFWTDAPVLLPQHHEMAKKQLKIDRVAIAWGTDPMESGKVYCRAVAEVSYFIGTRGDRRIEILSSGGLYGIDENSDPEYLDEIASEQLDELGLHLGVFGITATPEQWRELRRKAIDGHDKHRGRR